ncbi:ABC transporter permease [Citricoccus sp. NR2]|uniref:ABC transporter permease n=1 Tax=Citricoccus sp. NR2 TaxID=3004095 RepID=UPI0022DE2B61|nr:ABC transporter permease [Citricoccus sp. NR2]WBL19028.1 FtsX-like permease family protein [Citricoccus sp. NR2]
MKSKDVITSALGNTMRSKLRTFLTVIAIVVGAFTLTLTSGLGAGINKYVDQIVEGVGDSDQIYVMSAQQQNDPMAGSGEPVEYDESVQSGPGNEFGMTALTDDDIEAIGEIDNITEVNPMVFVMADYLEVPEGTKYTVDQLGFPSDINGMELLAGETPDPRQLEVIIPSTWLTTFGIDNEDNAEEALGETVTFGLKDMAQQEQTVEAEVVGVSEQMLSGVGGNPTPSQALNDELYDVQNSGLDVDVPESYIQAIAVVDDIDANIDQVKADLLAEEYLGMTVEDQLGMIQGIINTVTWVLNGFALIALVAASFGIVNTLLMSVQERTREIGLMKALGMSNGKVFGLFSMEAVLIGVMGSLIGVGLGVIVGVGGNAALVNGPLSGVAGLTLFAIEPVQLLLIVALIIAIAFVAGTLPARRASKKDPIEALRYE